HPAALDQDIGPVVVGRGHDPSVPDQHRIHVDLLPRPRACRPSGAASSTPPAGLTPPAGRPGPAAARRGGTARGPAPAASARREPGGCDGPPAAPAPERA